MAYVRYNLTFLIWWASTRDLPSALCALRHVLPGSSIALPCNFTIPSEISWIRQRSEEITLLAVTKNSFDKTMVTTFYEEKANLNVTKDNLTGIINLWIEEVGEGDLGFYFCSVRISGMLHFGSGRHLTFAGSTTQASFPVCWTLLAAMTAASTLLIAVLVYKLCHPTDHKTSACASCLGRSESLKTVELHYASLGLPSKAYEVLACPPVQRSPTSNGIIYATTAHQGAARLN